MQSNKIFFNIPLLLYVIFPSSVTSKDIDWSILSLNDTLVVFFNEVRVGMLYSKTSIDSANRVIELSTKVSISPDVDVVESFAGVGMNEIRKFDFNGSQVSAFQEMKSPSGTAIWRLGKKESGKWELSVTAGGMEKTSMLENAGGNLKSSYSIQEGIIKRSLSVGQEWKDTLFDMTSAVNLTFSTKCITIPDKNNPNYVFTSHNDLTGIEKRQEIDSSGRVILQEIPPIFVARRCKEGDKKGSGDIKKGRSKIKNLYELFNIPVKRAQKSNETIAVELKSGAKLHESVMRFYDYRNDKYILKNLNKKCHGTILSEKMEDFRDWLSPTIMIQSGNSEIKNLAMSLKGVRTCRCEISKIYNDYLFRNIEKRHVATFSNAYETLKAGYGDCGEHAVLLTALLRAVGIESNVVLGLVYDPEKKYYLGHAWVVVFIKDLVFIDPALGRFPVSKEYVPLVIDDDGTKIIYLAGLLGKFDISYIPRNLK